MNKWLIFYLLSFITMSSPSYAQSDIDSEQQLIYTYFYSKQPEEAKKIIDTAFLTSSKDSKKIIGYVYLADYYSFSNNDEKRIDALEKAKKIALKTKNDRDMAYVNFGLAQYYLKLDMNELFIDAVNKSINTFVKYPSENFILCRLYFFRYNYGLKNLSEKDNRTDCIRAKEYAIKSKNNILLNFTYNNLGYYYRRKQEITEDRKYLDSANVAYTASLKYANLINYPLARKRSEIAYYINYGGFGRHMYNDNGKTSLESYAKALKLSEGDKRFDEFTALTYNSIGSIYENLGNFSLAENYFLKAYSITKNNADISLINKIIISENLAIVYDKTGKFKTALEYERESKDLIKENAQKQFDDNAKSLDVFYQTEQRKLQIKQLEERNRAYNKQRILYIGIIFITVLACIGLMYILRYRHKINEQRTNLLEAEKKEIDLNLKIEKEEKARLKAEQELWEIQQEHLHRQALATNLQLEQKNTFINELKEKIKDKKAPGMDMILKEEQFADNDFASVQDIIKNVHPHFFKKLAEVSKSKLSNQDIRYAAYIYLNMDNQQIANILKVDSNTVRKTKHRLKTKLGLEKNQDLKHFIQNLEL